MYNLFLSGLVLALIYLVLQIPIWKYQQTAEILQAEVSSLTEEAEPTIQMLENLSQRHQSLAKLIDYKRRLHPMTDVLLELTNLSPDNTWLKHLKWTDSRLVFRGESKQTSTFIERLGKSPMFEKVDLPSPPVAIPGSLYERFHLTVTLSDRAGN